MKNRNLITFFKKHILGLLVFFALVFVLISIFDFTANSTKQNYIRVNRIEHKDNIEIEMFFCKKQIWGCQEIENSKRTSPKVNLTLNSFSNEMVKNIFDSLEKENKNRLRCRSFAIETKTRNEILRANLGGKLDKMEIVVHEDRTKKLKDIKTLNEEDGLVFNLLELVDNHVEETILREYNVKDLPSCRTGKNKINLTPTS